MQNNLHNKLSEIFTKDQVFYLFNPVKVWMTHNRVYIEYYGVMYCNTITSLKFLNLGCSEVIELNKKLGRKGRRVVKGYRAYFEGGDLMGIHKEFSFYKSFFLLILIAKRRTGKKVGFGFWKNYFMMVYGFIWI